MLCIFFEMDMCVCCRVCSLFEEEKKEGNKIDMYLFVLQYDVKSENIQGVKSISCEKCSVTFDL